MDNAEVERRRKLRQELREARAFGRLADDLFFVDCSVHGRQARDPDDGECFLCSTSNVDPRSTEEELKFNE